MLKVGMPGTVGDVEMQDLLFTHAGEYGRCHPRRVEYQGQERRVGRTMG